MGGWGGCLDDLTFFEIVIGLGLIINQSIKQKYKHYKLYHQTKNLSFLTPWQQKLNLPS